jgi:hypothetical protein
MSADEIFNNPTNRRSENIIVEMVIIPELKFRDVKWHTFGADLI